MFAFKILFSLPPNPLFDLGEGPGMDLQYPHPALPHLNEHKWGRGETSFWLRIIVRIQNSVLPSPKSAFRFGGRAGDGFAVPPPCPPPFERTQMGEGGNIILVANYCSHTNMQFSLPPNLLFNLGEGPGMDLQYPHPALPHLNEHKWGREVTLS